MFESVDIRCSIHDDTQIKSSSCLYISFAWQQESSVCLKMSLMTVYFAQRGRLCGNFHVAIMFYCTCNAER